MKIKPNILILGLTNKTGLALSRNISKMGFDVDGILFDDCAAKYSKYIREHYYLGKPSHDCIKFTEDLINHLKKFQYAALIPVHDGALEICRLYREKLEKHIQILGLNDEESYKYSIDKSELLKLGESIGLNIPNGQLVKNLQEFHSIDLDSIQFPVIAKPVSSAKIHHNKLLFFSVKLCNTPEELTDYVRENIQITSILIQEFIKGYGIGYNFIAKDGVIQNAYIHKRINEYKGVSSLRQSFTTEHFGLDEKVKNLVQQMNWNGVGMIEFMISNNKKPILMEFNGRFFGSTELSSRAGINLPQLFIKEFLLKESIPQQLSPKSVRVRFLHDEVLLYTSFLFKKKFGVFFNWLIDVISSRFQRDYFVEDSIFIDPKFSLGMYYFDFKRWISKRKNKKQIEKQQINTLSRAHLENKKKIVFFCFGNICRSPFAAELAKTISSEFQFSSLGIFPQEDRLPPSNACFAATKYGVNIENHLSKSFYSVNPNEVDLYLIMDKKNYLLLRNEGVPSSKIYFLAEQEIKDPYGGNVATFEKAYQQIYAEIEKLFK